MNQLDTAECKYYDEETIETLKGYAEALTASSEATQNSTMTLHLRLHNQRLHSHQPLKFYACLHRLSLVVDLEKHSNRYRHTEGIQKFDMPAPEVPSHLHLGVAMRNPTPQNHAVFRNTLRILRLRAP